MVRSPWVREPARPLASAPAPRLGGRERVRSGLDAPDARYVEARVAHLERDSLLGGRDRAAARGLDSAPIGRTRVGGPDVGSRAGISSGEIDRGAAASDLVPPISCDLAGESDTDRAREFVLNQATCGDPERQRGS